MIARGFKPVAWVAAVGTAALGCYMLSLQVAAERSELAGLEQRIVRARQDIRSLQTELGTRGRLQQLEQWNAEVLALSAPVAGQFLDSGLTLARFDTREQPMQVHEQVRLASAETPSAPPAVAAAQPRIVQARAELPAAGADRQPLVRRASLQVSPSPGPASAAVPAATQVRATTPVRAAVPSRSSSSSSLLDERTLRELGARAQSERGEGDDD